MTTLTSAEILPQPVKTPVQFDGQLVVSDESSVSVNVTITDDGVHFSTKKDDVGFHREQWLDAAVVDNVLVLIVHGYAFGQWAKKRKFEKKNPGAEFEFDPEIATYTISFKPKKLSCSVEELHLQVVRTFRLTYLDETEDPKSLQFVACEDCGETMDVTPYAKSPNLFCNECCNLLGRRVGGDAEQNGVCENCGFYTKLGKYDATTKTCHSCRVKLTFWAFLGSLGIALLIILANVATIVFLDRFFPVLLIIAGIMILGNIWLVIKVIALSAARTAVGATEIEKATTLLRKGKPNEAFAIINGMEGNTQENPGILLNLAKGLSKAGDHEQARNVVENLVEDFPNFQFGHLEKIQVLTKSQASEKEIEAAAEQAFVVIGRNTLRSSDRMRLVSLLG